MSYPDPGTSPADVTPFSLVEYMYFLSYMLQVMMDMTTTFQWRKGEESYGSLRKLSQNKDMFSTILDLQHQTESMKSTKALIWD